MMQYGRNFPFHFSVVSVSLLQVHYLIHSVHNGDYKPSPRMLIFCLPAKYQCIKVVSIVKTGITLPSQDLGQAEVLES